MGTKTVSCGCTRAFAALVILLVASCVLVAFDAQPAYALKASGGAKAYKLQPYGTYRYDITGDGVVDTIETDYDLVWDSYYDHFCVSGISICVNGEQAWHKALEPRSFDDFDYSDWTIQLITLANKHPVLK